MYLTNYFIKCFSLTHHIYSLHNSLRYNVLLYCIAMKIIPLLSMFDTLIGTVPYISLSVSVATITAYLAYVACVSSASENHYLKFVLVFFSFVQCLHYYI